MDYSIAQTMRFQLYTIILLLAILSRYQYQSISPTVDHVSSSSSVVRLYVYNTNNESSTTILNKDDGAMHIASIETACHALSISRGGKGLHGVLVIAKSSGIELHSLDAVVKEYLERILMRKQ